MTGRMNLIVIGNGEYENPRWPTLTHVQPHNGRLAEYVQQNWPSSYIITEGADQAWSAADLRTRLPSWMAQSGKEDDVLLLWSGHGLEKNGHRLITYDSPDPDQAPITSENAIATRELADYLMACRARRIVLLLNTCWSGDGGQELGALVGDAMNETPSKRQSRSMVIISSARREEARDGAFMSSIFKVLSSPGPPPGLGPEHRWAPSAPALSAGQLVEAVNLLLVDSNHQAQPSVPYGTVGTFFRRAHAPAAAAQLPPGVVGRLLGDFPGRLPIGPEPWDIARIKSAISQLGGGEPADELGYRLRRLALGLAALTFLERWLGSGPGLANRLGPAWRSVLRPIHRIPHPVERFGFIEQVTLHGTDGQIVEFVARVIRDAGDNPCDDRLYQWAEDKLGVDRQVVDDALSRINSPQVQSRLIINFGMTIADDEESDALPKSVIAWLYRPDELDHPRHEVAFDPPDVADMVAQMVAWARTEVAEISQVDVALPVSLFCAESRPEAAKLRLYGSLRRPVAALSGVVIRWSDRMLYADLCADGLRRGRTIDAAPRGLEWIDFGAYAQGQALLEALETPARAVAFSFKPDDPEFFYAAAYNSPYVMWPDGDITEIKGKITACWRDLPRQLAEAYSSSSPKNDVMRSVHAVWDDPDWLENIVPNLIVPQHRLTV